MGRPCQGASVAHVAMTKIEQTGPNTADGEKFRARRLNFSSLSPDPHRPHTSSAASGEEQETVVASNTSQIASPSFFYSIMAPAPAVPEPTRPSIVRSTSYVPNGIPAPPVTAPSLQTSESQPTLDAVLELADGTAFRGISFGAQGKSVSGECVFQTGTLQIPFFYKLDTRSTTIMNERIEKKMVIVCGDFEFGRYGWIYRVLD